MENKYEVGQVLFKCPTKSFKSYRVTIEDEELVHHREHGEIVLYKLSGFNSWHTEADLDAEFMPLAKDAQ